MATATGIFPDDAGIPPLQGIRVLDLTRYLSGPYCTMLLADGGAEVIKVEPARGEVNRELPQMMDLQDGESISTYFLRHNRGKKSVTLDIRSPEQRPLFEALIRSADVLVENFRPGAMDAWGLGWNELQRINPRLIYASISGFGHTESEYRSWPAFNLVAESMAGVVSQLPMEGSRPRAVGLPFGDSITSVYAAAGIAMALVRRATTGAGSRVDTAMYDAMLSMNEWSIALKSGADMNLDLGADHHGWFAPYGFFEASDGWLCICVISDDQWHALCKVAGLDDLAADPRLEHGTGRTKHLKDVIEPRLTQWLATRTRVETSKMLAETGVPSSPLQRAEELLDSEQANLREMIVDMKISGSSSIKLAGNPIRIEPRNMSHAEGFASVGQHNEEILSPLLASKE
ncbi:CoA transferase [Paeniglutamicibacter psychrophenolicus]|uniref:Crotonobetainyl-CoA:carnitine CoA-transferase CaiB-like acyl-CoA transferase n=1 Tax=Paeniglutamicibacter psychrophenolicus TaxID=257454 RepID=A0ABS4WKD8_9MICC|nr:CoA transferase [Paeniglutamicibacter psychrophenolicus]MBP2376433.1 crotonobetainyl-CoA:carnitine CoA-transferase CaiB-like acyl-CoA transferase [Paeniglutamicibacter psychrophenolicus]